MRLGRTRLATVALSLALVGNALTVAAAGAQDVEPEEERGAWLRIGELDLSRADHTATLLPDGTILVVGGTSALGRPVLTAELVYPESGATRPAGTLPWGLAGHQAAILPDGRVVLSGSDAYAGGEPVADQDVCARYPALVWDPATVDFSPIHGVPDSNGASVTVLEDGRVLFAGGESACIWDQALVGLDAARVWDPTTGEVTQTGALVTPRAFGPSALLDDGRVLVAGGLRLLSLPAGAAVQRSGSLEAWDPATGEWTSFGRAGLAIDTLVVLDDGLVAAIGEFDNGYGMRLLDPASGTLRPLDTSQAKPLQEAAVSELDGQLAFVGGLNRFGRPVAQTLVWDSATGDRERLVYPVSAADAGHTATALADGTIVVIGGRDMHDDGRVLNTVEAIRAEDRAGT